MVEHLPYLLLSAVLFLWVVFGAWTSTEPRVRDYDDTRDGGRYGGLH